VEIKLQAPVFAGQRLEYQVTRTRVFDDLVRFEVEAEADGRRVASGVLTGAQNIPQPPELEG
jgi:hypothetical protein